MLRAMKDTRIGLVAEERLVDRVLAAATPVEFRTFVLGFSRSEGYSRSEHEARWRAAKMRLGEELERRWPERVVDFTDPQARIDLHDDGSVLVRTSPIFIGGRYRKLSREIPASRWIHHACHGRGCASCDFTGNLCGPSIEELLGEPALRAAQGDGFLFHALGREDTDARMLGEGRPFILEVSHPRKRTIDLQALAREFAEAAGDLAEVRRLAMAERRDVGTLKTSRAEKTYRARVACDGAPPLDAQSRVLALADSTIAQLSPTRVAKKRGPSTLRRRRILDARWLGEADGEWLLEVRAEAGAYIKELVSGDDGRTRPSVTELLGLPCRCTALDVIGVHWQPPWERPLGAERAE